MSTLLLGFKRAARKQTRDSRAMEKKTLPKSQCSCTNYGEENVAAINLYFHFDNSSLALHHIDESLGVSFFSSEGRRTVYSTLRIWSSGERSRKMGNARVLASYVTICFVAFVISKIVISILIYQRCCKRRKVFQDSLSGGKIVLFRSPLIQSLTSESFMKKTMKLTNRDIIGAGGYGTVYKLCVSDSVIFAVKKLNKGTADRDKGFERELDAMGDIKHRNIVTLHGYYTAPNFNLLIYEFMPNGSLDSHLHGKLWNKKILDWDTRYRIALGTARGIAYLHHDCIPHIIHRDIKSSNILLDENMEARVSDFGLATLMRPDQTHVSTVVAGTFGYLAPEYFDTGRATSKGDVYSFGVVLLELLTGKRPTDEAFIEEGTKLVTWVKAVVEDDKEEYAVDNELGSSPLVEVKNVFNIAMKCLESDPTKRPTMAEVFKMIELVKADGFVCQSELPETSEGSL